MPQVALLHTWVGEDQCSVSPLQRYYLSRTHWALIIIIITTTIIIIIIIIIMLLLLLLLLTTAVELSIGGSSPYTSTDKMNKNKYT